MQQTLNLYYLDGKNAILSLLSDYQFHPTYEIARLAKQYNARIYELRKEGYNILSNIYNGIYGFKLYTTFSELPKENNQNIVVGDVYI